MAVVLAATGVLLYARFRSDLDASLNEELRSRSAEITARVAAGERLGGAAQPAAAAELESFAQVIGPGGVLDTTAPVEPRPVLSAAQLAQARRGPVRIDRGPPAGLEDPVRLLAAPVERDGQTLVVVAGRLRDDRDEALSFMRTVLLTGGPLALLLASLAGYALTGAALRPVEAMRRRAADISHLEIGARRLPVPDARDELAQLADTLNEMLDRLARSLERERGFVASASHELRTPLALLKGELELARREGRSVEELRAAIASAAEESDRLVQLAEDLLVLARSDQGRLPVRAEPLDALELLERVAGRFAHRAAETGRELTVDAPPELTVEADPLRAEQALGNLVDNALRHGDGSVELAAVLVGARVELHVRDRGPGFGDAAATAFEPFTRGDPARGRGGTGLGLAVVDAVARAHGGATGARDRDGGGADAWIELPGRSSTSHPREPHFAGKPEEGGS